MRIKEITNTADKARLDGLKRNKDNASNALKAERQRQKLSKARQQATDASQALSKLA